MTTEATATQIPNNVTEWIETLPAREGWGAWEAVNRSVYEGVQCWSLRGEDLTAVGVWGNVVEPNEYDEDSEERIEWAIYVGGCHDPQETGYETAASAMRAAEYAFPHMFCKTEFVLTACEDRDLPPDLRQEATDCLYATEAYRFEIAGQAEAGKVLFIPSERRAGVAHGADAQWTDARTAEEAVCRFLTGSMVE